MRNDLKELLMLAPKLKPDELLTDAAKILIALLAHQGSRSPEEWLANRLRAVVVGEIAASFPDAVPAKFKFTTSDRTTSEFAPPIVASLWTQGDIESCLQTLEVPAREALAALQTALPKPRMHQLWSGTVDANKGYRDEAKREWDVRLAKSGPYREYLRPTPTQIRALTQLGHDAPNLSAATDYLISHVQLARRSRIGLRSGPRVLLIGPPAAGKTWWAEQVAVALGVACTTISLANVTASFEISGGSTQWMSAKPGRIVRAFLSSASASPVIVLDEVDKALTRNGYPTADALLDLVDRSSATRWHDEFYARDFNVATAIIIATANDPDKIEPPMRSRFQCFNVSAPRPDQMAAMVRSVWRHYRRMRHDLVLPSTLDDEVVEHIATHSEDARSVMREFDRAVANAAERGGRIRIGKADLRHPKPDSVYLPDPQDGALVH